MIRTFREPVQLCLVGLTTGEFPVKLPNWGGFGGMATNGPADEYLTTREAAGIAKVTQDTIIQWCQSGYITCTRSRTRRWRISRQSLLAFVLGEPPENSTDEPPSSR